MDTGVTLARVRRRPVARRTRWWLPTPKTVVITLVVLIVGYLALVPLWYLLWGTFFDDNGFTLSGFDRAYNDPYIGEMVRNSLWFAIGASCLALVVGTALAYLYVRIDVPFRGLLLAASAIPLVIPGILYTIAWVFLASPQIGLINKYVEPVLGPGFFDIFSVWGMIWVEGLHMAPIVFLMMAASFRSMDPSLEESALMSGASRWQVLTRIVLPLSRPAVIGAMLIAVVRSLESFEVPALLGLPNNTYVFTSQIYRILSTYPTDLSAAGALSVGLLLLAILGVGVAALANRSARRFQTVSGKAFRPRRTSLGRWRLPVGIAIVAYFLLAVVAPVLVLVYTSLLPRYQAPSRAVFAGMTLDNYRDVFENDKFLTAMKNSVLLGVGSATLVMLLLAVAAFVVVRSKVRGRQIIEQLTFLPLVVPGLVMGLGISFVYLRSPIPIYGTIWILLISYCTRYMPYGMRYAMTSMQQISVELEESAGVSGASWLQSFRRIVLPLMAPGLIAGWTYILIVSFRELSSSILLYSPGTEVVAVVLFQEYENGEFPTVAALGVVMVATLTILILIGQKVAGRVGISER
jgi:iron(III) transport system permease protein